MSYFSNFVIAFRTLLFCAEPIRADFLLFDSEAVSGELFFRFGGGAAAKSVSLATSVEARDAAREGLLISGI